MTDCRCVRVANAVATNGCPIHGPKRQEPVKPTDAGPAPRPKKPRASAAGQSGPAGRSVWNPETGECEPK